MAQERFKVSSGHAGAADSAPAAARCYFISYWVREEQWVPRESLIRLHPLQWLILEKRETLNHIHLVAWQEIDEATYAQYHHQLVEVDDEFNEPTQTRLVPGSPPDKP